jgi:hypothetical protein
MKHLIGSLLLVSSLAGAGGCMVDAQAGVAAPVPVAAVEVEEAPPPPRPIVVAYRPGYVFVQGHWFRRYGRWDWYNGYYLRERPGYVWMGGRWNVHAGRHVWVEGGWRHR